MSQNRKKPNIIFILTDDQGVWSLGSYGNQEVISPVVDQIAEEGVRFENFYCTSPVCSPARASILTGKMPSQHGVVDWLGGGSVDKKDFEGVKINYKKSIPYLAKAPADPTSIPDDAEIGFEETISYQKYMNYERGGIQFLKDIPCYTEILHRNGYQCGLAGKWHLGDSANPQKGFEFWEVIARGGTNYMLPEMVRDGKMTLENRYVTDLITDDALRFIDAQDEDPFYLGIHYTAPHDPWKKEDQPKEIWDLYEDCEFQSVPVTERHPWQKAARTQPHSEQERKDLVRGYYTCITAMDRNIKRVLDKLEETGQMENTIILFSSDNGFNMGHHGTWGKGNATFPLNVFETSVKVPMIVYGPGIAKGKVIPAPASQYDLFPTILDLTGCMDEAAAAYMKTLPGSSMKAILTGKEDGSDKDVVIYDEYGPVRMIRDRRYKFVYRAVYGPHELYDLENDPDEEQNLIDDPAYRDLRNQLFVRLREWFDQFGCGPYDATRFPVDGDGQMNRLEDFGTDKTVFKNFT